MHIYLFYTYLNHRHPMRMFHLPFLTINCQIIKGIAIQCD